MDFRDETQDWDDEDWDILDTMYHKHEFHLVPSRWADYQKLATLSWQTVRFDETNSTQIPTSSGIYAFCVEPHITDSLGACFVMYFGQANNLKRRYGEYTREIRAKQGAGRPYVKRMKYYKKAGYLYFYFVQIDSSMVPSSNTLAQFITALEDGLIAAFTPPVNKQILDAKVRRAEAAF